MGWLKNLWKNVTGWIKDNIVEPIVDWVKQLIDDTRTFITIWKHEFRQLLAGWLENDWVFLGAVAATIALAFYFPAIKEWVGKWSITILLKAAWEDVKEGFADILDFIHIIDLDTVNTILKVLWPDWRTMMAQLAEVSSALAEELGEGSAYFHAYFSVIHGLAMVENAIIGTDPKLAEMQAFEATNKALININDRFWRYAENPGEAVTDIIEEFYLPRAENLRIAQQDQMDSIRDNRDRVVEINTALHEFDNRLTHFIEIQPDELQEIISDRLQPISDALGDALWVMDTEIMPKINAIVDALALQTERQQTVNDNILARLNSPYGLLAYGELLGVEEQVSLEDYIQELNRRADERELDESAPGLDYVVEGLIGATGDYFQEGLAVPQPRREALALELPGIPSTTDFPSWFRGEG